jgi:hypothetical protein
MKRKRGNSWHFSVMITMLLLIAIFQGCGKKGDPIPDKVLLPKAISNLEAKHGQGGIILRWSLEEHEVLAGFRITRSEGGTASGSCPACPGEYTLIADLSLEDPKLTREGKGAFSYIDATVEPGRIYSYRVVVCNASGGCSEASNIVEIK